MKYDGAIDDLIGDLEEHGLRQDAQDVRNAWDAAEPMAAVYIAVRALARVDGAAPSNTAIVEDILAHSLEGQDWEDWDVEKACRKLLERAVASEPS